MLISLSKMVEFSTEELFHRPQEYNIAYKHSLISGKYQHKHSI